MKDISNQVLTIFNNKGVCNFTIDCNSCIFDTDCQRNRTNTKDMITFRYLAAKDLIKLNPHIFNEEEIFKVLL